MEITTAFYLETVEGGECRICITGEITAAQAAATDCYGRATECATDSEVQITYFELYGVEFEPTEEIAKDFLCYDTRHKACRAMNLSDFHARCVEEILFAEQFGDALPF